jgi:acetyl esterase/lipase
MGSVLAEAGVSVELHVYPGAPHASDALTPNAESSRRAIIAACAD